MSRGCKVLATGPTKPQETDETLGGLATSQKSWKHPVQAETDMPETFLSKTNQSSCADENLDQDGRRLVDAALAILAQGEELLRTLPQERYVQRIPQAGNGSIGAHYRHCLDHFSSLLKSLHLSVVDYDLRERDVRIETQTEFALLRTQEICAALDSIPPQRLQDPVWARCQVSYAPGESPVTRSTFSRELVYAIAHAIHHYALISIMARLMEASLPDRFGIAPSTLAYHHSKEAHP